MPVLLAMSLLSWIVILAKVLDLVRLRQMARHAELRFWRPVRYRMEHLSCIDRHRDVRHSNG